jgi:hypothetical protein
MLSSSLGGSGGSLAAGRVRGVVAEPGVVGAHVQTRRIIA